MGRRREQVRQTYLILAGNGLSDEKKEYLETIAKGFQTPAQAIQYCDQEAAKKREQIAKLTAKDVKEKTPAYVEASRAGWQYNYMISRRLFLITFDGIEVCLFYDRTTIQISSDPEDVTDVIDARKLRSRDEAWMRIPLLETKSAMKQAQFFTKEFDEVRLRRDQLQKLANTQRIENDLLVDKITQLERQLEEAKKVKV